MPSLVARVASALGAPPSQSPTSAAGVQFEVVAAVGGPLAGRGELACTGSAASASSSTASVLAGRERAIEGGGSTVAARSAASQDHDADGANAAWVKPRVVLMGETGVRAADEPETARTVRVWVATAAQMQSLVALDAAADFVAAAAARPAQQVVLAVVVGAGEDATQTAADEVRRRVAAHGGARVAAVLDRVVVVSVPPTASVGEALFEACSAASVRGALLGSGLA